MTLDLLHNKIIKETLTERFEKSVNDNLVPKLYALYGTSLEGVQFYEDYINDEFIKDGYWYYPLTVVIGGIHAVIWIKWDISVAGDFEGGVPYAYVGNGGIDFILADDVPIAFKNSLEGRSNYFEGGYVKLNVTTDAPNPKILAGKYSQTFVDEMNRQISDAICRACGVKGLAESSIELDIVFAPNTYMEHTSENVTYRRLLISAKGCSARDFWIKWTRKNSAVAYSVNDNVAESDIIFELGEDVSQKIREKEYRFLVYGNSDKYRVAMGRKNVTEWRELIKRAVKRGELFKTTAELEENAHVAEVSDKLSEILEKCGVSVPAATSNEIRVDAEAANEALRLAVLGNGEAESESYVPEIISENEAPAEENVPEAEVDIASEAEAAALDTAEVLEAKELEIVEDAADESEENNAVFDNMPDDELGEFDFGNPTDVFEAAEESTEELSFEDILEEFIPKTAAVEEEYVPEPVSVDISDIDESESVRFDISKTDVPFDMDKENVSDVTEELPELEVELYEEEAEEESEDIESEPVEESYVAEEEELEAEESEAEEVELYDELSKIEDREENEEVLESAPVSVYDNQALVRLENEIASLKHQLEMERIAKEAAEAKLEEALLEKANAKNELDAENSAVAELEEKLRLVTAAKENAENQLNLELLAAAELRAQNEKQKFAIEQVKRLVEEETAAKEEAELQLEILKSETEILKSENENLKEAARIADEACRVAEEMCKHHERELLNQIELAEKERVREKNLFAEAARQAKEENEERFAELKEAEIARITEEARIEALRRAEDERLRLQDELRFGTEAAEVTPSSEELEETRKKELEERARAARLRMEEKARINAEAKASVWADYKAPTIPVYESDAENEEKGTPEAPLSDEIYSGTAGAIEAVAEEPAFEPAPAPVVNYTYTSYIVRLMFRRSADPNVTARIHEMISYALTDFGKDHVYMKVKASMPDNYTVVLNFVEFPKEEFDLLVDIINYLGKSDLGVYKVVLD